MTFQNKHFLHFPPNAINALCDSDIQYLTSLEQLQWLWKQQSRVAFSTFNLEVLGQWTNFPRSLVKFDISRHFESGVPETPFTNISLEAELKINSADTSPASTSNVRNKKQ